MKDIKIRVLSEEPMDSSDEDYLIYPLDSGDEGLPVWEVLNPSALSPSVQLSSLADALAYLGDEIEAVIEEDA